MVFTRGVAAVAAIVLGASSGGGAPDTSGREAAECGASRIALALLVDTDRASAARYAAANHLDVSLTGDGEGDRVVAQAPDAATEICPGDEVSLELR
ncbi:MAG TPA: hypothetical protein VMY34_09340 [Acidimicrobiales bacterium]|nr:hypothetical protein [Acidimicrobiales bacterium]